MLFVIAKIFDCDNLMIHDNKLRAPAIAKTNNQ